jgi:hypothetical protein
MNNLINAVHTALGVACSITPKATKRTKSFGIGDMVRLASAKDRKKYAEMTHGYVVYYRGTHDPKEPRVRWHSGWGTSTDASVLALIPVKERAALPPVKIVHCDLKY